MFPNTHSSQNPQSSHFPLTKQSSAIIAKLLYHFEEIVTLLHDWLAQYLNSTIENSYSSCIRFTYIVVSIWFYIVLCIYSFKPKSLVPGWKNMHRVQMNERWKFHEVNGAMSNRLRNSQNLLLFKILEGAKDHYGCWKE